MMRTAWMRIAWIGYDGSHMEEKPRTRMKPDERVPATRR
jgi:hypothetical protein